MQFSEFLSNWLIIIISIIVVVGSIGFSIFLYFYQKKYQKIEDDDI